MASSVSDSISKGQIYSLFVSLKESGEDTVDGVNKKCEELFPVSFQNCKSSRKSIYLKVKKVYDEITYAKRSSKNVAESKLSECFQFPKFITNLERATGSLTPRKRKLKEELVATKELNKKLKKNLSEALTKNKNLRNESEALDEKYFCYIASMQKVIDEANTLLSKKDSALSDFQQEIDSNHKQFSKLSEQIDKLSSKYEKCKEKMNKNSTRNLNKKLKRRDVTMEKQREMLAEKDHAQKELQFQIEKYANDLATIETKLDNSKTEIIDLKSEKHKMQKKVCYMKIQVEKAKRGRAGDFLANEKYLNEIDDLKDSVKDLERENAELEQLVSLLEGEDVITFKDGKYTDEVRETVMDLLGMNVSMNRVNDVIKTVLRNLAGKDIDRLPSNALKSRLLVEARFLAQKQVAECMIQGADPTSLSGNCLHGDGTSKYHRHFQSFQVSTLSGKTLTIGLHEMGGSSTADVLKSFNDCVEELAVTLDGNEEGRDVNVAKLVSSIKNTMSDQGAVNPCFNRELEIIRKDALPLAIEKWNDLGEQAKSDIVSMGNFYCKMHLLVNFATECDKTLKVFETVCAEDPKVNASGSGYHTSECGAARLVRTAVKAFHSHGSEEAGVASHFQAYLDGKEKKMKLVSYRGNRFNILFYDSAALYYHKDDVIDFLNHWPNPNLLLKAVLSDITNKSYLAGIRALGMVDKLITGPLWRKIEAAQSILMINSDLLQLKCTLEEGCKDASELMLGRGPFCDGITHKDELYDKLFGDSGDLELDCLTQECIEMLCHCLLLILERQASDQLPGGKYWVESTVQTSNVPTTNTVSERDFAVLDLLMRNKPNATVLTHEALAMWMNNKTSEWLHSRSSTEKSDLLRTARENVDKVREKFKSRKEQIKQKRIESLKKRQENEENAQVRKTAKKVSYSNKLTELCGKVWTNEPEVDCECARISDEKERRDAVTSQINFHRHVLLSRGDRNLFYINRHNKNIPVVTLIQNLKEIIRLNPTSNSSEKTNSGGLVKEAGKRKQDIDIEKGKLAAKLKEQRLKRIINQQKSFLDSLISDPKSLIGKKVKHQCKEEGSDEIFWCNGVVLGIHKQNDNALKVEYTIHYEEDDEGTYWHFNLLKDMKNGELIITE